MKMLIYFSFLPPENLTLPCPGRICYGKRIVVLQKHNGKVGL